ncbi:NitT/TauT family transport system ATP-binding protein [Leucobacter luti]|uniref:ABC transporter ATP-binding protein n=1 Tax=Leucobacter luti TaxID=340320 RepID=UPI001051D29B|nr:nitrate/sulfonate/bicarbonate ABC transporter ATP-binding protein [Leucobacter luti]MCW2287667.1 NitT/TauT family transport system ATP-binding protein [Leucobacter luti]TCK46168.1 NitT/TauT family transport system ATP-binding protein [Leucobacter luti]
MSFEKLPPASSSGQVPTAPDEDALILADHVSLSFPAADGGAYDVLTEVSLALRPGEIVALLGKSGSGKSTLLRLLAGLIEPSSGSVHYRGERLNGANPGAAMVFQSFALMPWLTVLDNVELGIRGTGLPRAQRRALALDAIDAIGLDGFESAYPRELSGGMRQRVGFARAFVQHPDVLLMDEPFSALDVLTAENLRGELISMWGAADFPTRSICIVTHNIDEAVQLADRVLVLGGSPARITAEVPIVLPRPRDRRSPTFDAAVDHLYGLLTGREDGARAHLVPGPLTHPLPEATVGGLAGLVQIVVAHGGQTDLPDLADELAFDVDDLLPLVDAAQMLGLLEVAGAQAFLTETGWAWQSADMQASKRQFAKLAVAGAPLVSTIVRALEHSNDGALRDDFFRDLLRRGFTADDAQRQLELAIDWGRYGELFDYDANAGEFVLAEVASGLADWLEGDQPDRGSDPS